MQVSTIPNVLLLSCVFFFNNNVLGDKNEFPREACTNAVSSGNYGPCANELFKSIFKWHQWSRNKPHKICGIPCISNWKGRFSNWKWVWDGQFRCDSKAPGIVGIAAEYSKSQVIELAMNDFRNKAIAAGQMKAEEFQC